MQQHEQKLNEMWMNRTVCLVENPELYASSVKTEILIMDWTEYWIVELKNFGGGKGDVWSI